MELELIRQVRAAGLSFFLETDDSINKGWVGPRFRYALGLQVTDQIGGGFFDHAEAVEFELADDSGLTRSGSTGDDEASHEWLLLSVRAFLVLCN